MSCRGGRSYTLIEAGRRGVIRDLLVGVSDMSCQGGSRVEAFPARGAHVTRRLALFFARSGRLLLELPGI
eukprot:6665181-Heterocapsa_arctica.AAC.1